MKQFRGITVRLNHKVVVMNKKGEPVEEIHNDFFNVRINNAIPLDHKNFQSCEQ